MRIGVRCVQINQAAIALAVAATVALSSAPMAWAAAEQAVAMPTVATHGMPHLEQQHGATQLVVNGRPFLAIGGELQNSSASSLKFMDEQVWPKAVAMHFNTVIAPVYWDLIEPQQDRFDFTTVDGLIAGARARHIKLVLLWFGTWKNSMSCYVPDWVKENQTRFPRAESADGRKLEILSAVSKSNLDQDKAAFVALMRHLKQIDGAQHTVILVQVENEVGMIEVGLVFAPGGVQPRDQSPAANQAFQQPVPSALTDYLKQHQATLQPWLKQIWESHGATTGASWTATFGPGPVTDDLFTTWTEAQYTSQVAAAGEKVYPLPMYVNAALVGPGNPVGTVPNGAPLPQLFDLWRAAVQATGGAINFFSPDIYSPNFKHWADAYAQPWNPLFVPESGGASPANLGVNALYAFGEHNAMGYSVYAPEFLPADQQKALGDAYDVIRQITPLILQKQGTAEMVGIRTPMSRSGKEDLSPQTFQLGGYQFTAQFTHQSYAQRGKPLPGAHGGLVIAMGPNQFLIAGTGMSLQFSGTGKPGAQAGIDSIWEGQFVDGKWTPGRELNGDDDHQGRWLPLPSNQLVLRMVRLYPCQ
ncbi:MAG: DUF5597 domain-containing protein [Acidobacteriaceae bacterium]